MLQLFTGVDDFEGGHQAMRRKQGHGILNAVASGVVSALCAQTLACVASTAEQFLLHILKHRHTSVMP